MSWFIVKQNWTRSIEAARSIGLADFWGLGGNVWPLSEYDDEESQRLTRNVDKSREYVRVPGGEDAYIFVMAEKAHACGYLAHCHEKELDALLLELDFAADSNISFDGYDLGNPEGGYSLIESEVLVKKRSGCTECLTGTGLFRSLSHGRNILSMVEDNTDLAYATWVGIRAVVD